MNSSSQSKAGTGTGTRAAAEAGPTPAVKGEHRPATSAFILAFAAIYLVWGSTYLGIRIAVETLPPFLMASLRFCVSGLVLLAFLRLTRGPLGVTPRQWLDNTLIGGFLLLGGNGLVSWAEKSIPSGVTALIIGAQPLLMVLTEWLWPGGTRPSLRASLGLVIGFAGVAWLVAPWQGADLPDSLPLSGILAILCACISWAFGSIYGRKVRDAAPPFVASGLQMLMGSLLLGLVALMRGEWSTWSPATVSSASWWALLYLTFVGSLVGYSTFAWLMKHSTPARVSTYAYVNPVVAVFLGWLVLDEALGPRTLAASGLIVLSVVLIKLQGSKGGERRS